MAAQRDRSPARPPSHHLDAPERERLFSRMLLIRLFEDRLLQLFEEGRLTGTTHTCVGQEAISLAAAESLTRDDLVFASHRNHGHYLARYDDPEGLLAELLGKEGGVCGGRGGSQNICRDGFHSAGIQGGYMPVVTGMAMAEKRLASGRLVCAFIGDGTLGEGALYESLNLAALWKVPLLVVVENNRYAQTTPLEVNLAGSIPARFSAFGIPVAETDSSEMEDLIPFFRREVEALRRSGGPRAVLAHTYRLRAHSKGDDDRPEEEIRPWREKDPLLLAGRHIDPGRKTAIEKEVRERLEEVERRVWAMDPAPGGPVSSRGRFAENRG